MHILKTTGVAFALSLALVSGFNTKAFALNCDQLGSGWELYGDFQVILEGSFGREGTFGPSDVRLHTPFHYTLTKQSSDIYIFDAYSVISTGKMYSQCYSPQVARNQIYAKAVLLYDGLGANQVDTVQINAEKPDHFGHPEYFRLTYRITGPNPNVTFTTGGNFIAVLPPKANEPITYFNYNGMKDYPVPITDTPPVKPAEKALQDKASTAPPKRDGQSTSDSTNSAGDPVDLFSGSFQVQNIDLAVPGIIQPQLARLWDFNIYRTG